jgi:hypothetical protein
MQTPENPVQIDDLTVFSQEAGALAERMAEGQHFATEIGLRVLLAEMQALAALLPAVSPTLAHLESDAEIEAGFDNMPV